MDIEGFAVKTMRSTGCPGLRHLCLNKTTISQSAHANLPQPGILEGHNTNSSKGLSLNNVMPRTTTASSAFLTPSPTPTRWGDPHLVLTVQSVESVQLRRRQPGKHYKSIPNEQRDNKECIVSFQVQAGEQERRR